MDAPRLLSATARAHSGKLSLVALGPLTNVADALLDDPSLAANIKTTYIMGGAVNVPGNVLLTGGEMSGAEWNFYADPRAAALTLQSGMTITLVPLDATNSVPLTHDYFNALELNHSTPAANFVYRLLDDNNFLFDSGEYYLWDTLAAVIFTDRGLATLQDARLKIIEDGPDSGRTAIDPAGAVVRYAVSADAPRFRQQLLDVLNLKH
jgi:pyrimidine-specific ribonucleoside hydrolase